MMRRADIDDAACCSASLRHRNVRGSILMSLAIGHFGWLDLPAHPINLGRAVGAVLIVGGIALISRF
jgi:uncharacterized membrane protein YdcZ (DUF606 family)